MVSIFSTIIFFSFIIPMTIHMLALMRDSNIQASSNQEEFKLKHTRKKRIKLIILLFILLPITMTLFFLCNHLITRVN